MLDSYNPAGSTRHVNFTTSKTGLWTTDSRKCQVNLAVLDSDWEAEFCRAVESHPNVMAYVKNHNLGLEVPYLYGSTPRTYIPDFIVRVDDGQDDPLNLIIEIKGYRGEDVREKNNAMEAYWLPGVNALGQYGHWDFAEFNSVYEIESNLHRLIDSYRERGYGGAVNMDRRPAGTGDVVGARPVENIHQSFGEAMVEKHRREGEDMLKFRDFERGLGDAGQSFSQRERYLLFLEHESHLSEEGREQFLRFLRHERPYLHDYNLDALKITIPDDHDSD